MTVLVPVVWVGRTWAWARVRPAGAHSLVAELAFAAIGTVVGGFNDWSSVDVYHIYDYGVPTDLPGVSSLPVWMLLYWGLILRFLATLALFEGSGADPVPRNIVRLGRYASTRSCVKIGVQLVLVVATRQAIYRTYLDPVLSWLPFVAATAIHFALFGWDHRDRWLVVLALAVGPLVEIAYIQVGGLHRYHLGWLGGVPLWIALWWAVAVLIWRDLAPRLLGLIATIVASEREPIPAP